MRPKRVIIPNAVSFWNSDRAGSQSVGEFNFEWAGDASGQRDGCDTTSHPHHALAGRTDGRICGGAYAAAAGRHVDYVCVPINAH